MEYINEQINETGAVNAEGYVSGLSALENITKEQEKTGSKITRFFKSQYRRVLAFGLALAAVFTLSACKNDEKANEETTSISAEMLDEDNRHVIPETELFNILLNKSASEVQRDVLLSVGNFLADYNIRFAEPIEDEVTLYDKEGNVIETITVRPALTWDEVMGLTLAYNDFSKKDLKEILNGSEIDSRKLNDAYLMGTLQLMGAHVLETSANPVNMDMILHSEEARTFYNKYHTLFLKAKESTGEERLAAVQAFYDEIYKDFPISAEERQVGIAHSDDRAKIEPYKFSIVPMLSAAEVMFQNLEVDYTLSQEAIDYLNDIGGCNIAEDILDKAEYISLSTDPNEAYADYMAVRASMISYLVEQKAYVIDDTHRELTYLPAFQEIVNGYVLEPYTYTITSTYTTTEYYTEREETTTDDRDEAVRQAGEEAVADAEREAQEEMDRENEEARREAEEEADEKAEEIQEEEDKKTEENEEAVEEDDKDYQDNIDDANENNNNGGNVNEDDLGHGTDFDDEHSNENGDLDDSVTDITTDPSGDQTYEPLPDPNAPTYSSASESYSYGSETDYTASTQSTEAAASDTTTTTSEVYEYEEPYTFTTEEEVDAYIEALAAPTSYTETSKVYTYTL